MLSDETAGRMIGFNFEEADEPLKGKPRTIRVEKTEYPFGRPVVATATVTDYDRKGRVIERRVYRADGTLSFHEGFQYEADPRAHTFQILDAQGEIISTRKVLTHPDGEESTVPGASGGITERTRTRRDSEGRVIEAISEDTVRDAEIRMQIDYRAGPAEAHVTFSRGPERDIHLAAGPDATSVSYRDSMGVTGTSFGCAAHSCAIQRC